jgi:A/G-specific adenine glycosylase
LPFLRGQWLLPGRARKAVKKPRAYDYHHSITHHDIYVTISQADLKMGQNDKWIQLKEIRRHVPASLVQKALARAASVERLQPPSGGQKARARGPSSRK